MKILHMADCHIGSPMNTHLEGENALARQKELLVTFQNCIRSAELHDVRLVLLAGDLFDTEKPKERTAAAVKGVFRTYPQIDFILIEGNHDQGTARLFEGMENVHIATGGWGVFAYPEENVTVYAASYPLRDELLADMPALSDGKNIVMLHGSLTASSHTDGATIPKAVLDGKKIDYLALGHYHKYKVEPLADGGIACYAGTPEGRGFDESGPCGVVLLDSEALDKPTFLPMAQRILHRIELDASDCHTQAELEALVYAQTKDIPAADMLHITLVGDFKEEYTRDPSLLEKTLAQTYYFCKVKDESRLAIDAADYENSPSLRGEFVRLVLATLPEGEDRDRILRFGLRALRGEDIET